MAITKIAENTSGAAAAQIIYDNDAQSYNAIHQTATPAFKFGVTPVDSATASATTLVYTQKTFDIPANSKASSITFDAQNAGNVTLIQLRLSGVNYVEVYRQVFSALTGLNTFAINIPVLAGDLFGINGPLSYTTSAVRYYSSAITGSYTFTKAAFDAATTAASVNYQISIDAVPAGINQKLENLPDNPGDIIQVGDLTTITGSNIFDKATMRVFNAFVNNTGGLTTSGVQATDSIYARIPVSPSIQVNFNLPNVSLNNGGAIRFENSAGTLLSYVGYTTLPTNTTNNGRVATIPADTAFIVMNIFLSFIPSLFPDQTDILQVVAGTSLGPYAAFTQDIVKIKDLNIQDVTARTVADEAKATVDSILDNRFRGLTYEMMGDSMVAGHTLTNTQTRFYKVAQRLAMSYINSGINGNRLTSTGGSGVPVVERYMDMSPTAKLKGIFIGTNDAAAVVTMGATTSTNPAEFNGALNIVLDGLQTLFPTDTILVWTPYVRNGNSLAYINAIVAACQKYGIPCFNNATLGGINWLNEAQKAALTLNDTYHLNEAGMTYASYRDAGFINQF